DRLAENRQRGVELLAIIGAVIDHQFKHALSGARGLDDALDLLGRKYGMTVERKGLGLRLLQLDRDVVAGALGDTVDGARIGIVHPRIDFEPEALSLAVLPGCR